MRFFSILLLMLLHVLCGYSQKASTLIGRISDGASFLPGVTVRLSASRTTASDMEGRFQFNNIEPGPYELSFSIIGFKTVQQKVEVKQGLIDLGNLLLNEASSELQAVVVRGNTAPSQIRALAIKRNALSFMDVLAADAIGKLPDRNAAEAVQRLPAASVNRYHGEANQVSVRGTPYSWSSTLYNGTRLPSANFGNRNTALDAIPAEMIQYVQLSKVLTPDMEGDAIGGSINFITRSAPSARTLNVSAAGGYNEKAQQPSYNFSAVYGDRLFNNKFGFILAGSIWNRNFAADEVVVDYNLAAVDPSQRYAINTINAKRYLGHRKTAAINVAAEYEVNSRHKFYTRLIHDRFDDVRPVTESFYEFSRRRYRYSYRYSHYETRLQGYEFGANHKVGARLRMDWRFSSYDMRYALNTPPGMPADKRGLPIAQFFQSLTGNFGNRSADGLIYNSFDAPDKTGIDPLHVDPRLTNPAADAINPAKLRLQQLVIFQLDQKDFDRVFSFNTQYDVNPKLNFRAGVKGRFKEFAGQMTPLVYLPNASLGIPGSAPMKFLSELGTEPFRAGSTYFREINNPFPQFMINPPTKNQLFDIFTPAFFEANDIKDYSAASNPTTGYSGNENVLAGYLMGVYDATKQLKLIGGLRNEYTEITLNSFRYDNRTKTIEPVRTTNRYHSLLPMVQAKYQLKPNTNLRLAYTKTLARANFPDLSPAENVDITGGQARITRGNADLRPTYSHNFDLIGEVFLSDIGQLTAGVFYKRLRNYIFRDLFFENIGGTSYFVTQPKNLQDANLLGAEAGFTKRFTKLKGFWGGLGADFNISVIRSSLEVPRYDVEGKLLVVDQTTIPQQSRLLYNAALFYEKDGYTFRLAANYRGRSVESINQNLGPDYYTYVDNNLTVDFSGAYAFGKKINVFLEVRNLTNEPFRQYLGNNRNRITNSEWFSINGQIGIRCKLY